MINEREETEGEWCGQRRYHGQRLAVERSLCVIKPRAGDGEEEAREAGACPPRSRGHSAVRVGAQADG